MAKFPIRLTLRPTKNRNLKAHFGSRKLKFRHKVGNGVYILGKKQNSRYLHLKRVNGGVLKILKM